MIEDLAGVKKKMTIFRKCFINRLLYKKETYTEHPDSEEGGPEPFFSTLGKEARKNDSLLFLSVSTMQPVFQVAFLFLCWCFCFSPVWE